MGTSVTEFGVDNQFEACATKNVSVKKANPLEGLYESAKGMFTNSSIGATSSVTVPSISQTITLIFSIRKSHFSIP